MPYCTGWPLSGRRSGATGCRLLTIKDEKGIPYSEEGQDYILVLTLDHDLIPGRPSGLYKG